jgi:hypothetical protein
MNRCTECNKFKPWTELQLTRFVPDTPFGPEVSEYMCTECRKKLSEGARRLA